MSERVKIKVEHNVLHLPAIALRGLVVFPGSVIHFEVGREKSIAAIWKLKESGRLDKLKPSLRETALAREEYAEESLQDLAERLGITKSCLNHRLRKLAELAKEN